MLNINIKYKVTYIFKEIKAKQCVQKGISNYVKYRKQLLVLSKSVETITTMRVGDHFYLPPLSKC